jgi:26S proteasome regulatory subunit N3
MCYPSRMQDSTSFCHHSLYPFDRMPDANMTSAAKIKEKEAAIENGVKPTKPITPRSPKDLSLSLLRHNLALIVRSVVQLEPRFAARAIRTITSTRKLCLLHPDVLARLVEEGTIKESTIRAQLLSHLPHPYTPTPSSSVKTATADAMDVDVTADAAKADNTKKTTTKDATDTPFKHVAEATSDLDAYLSLLVAVYLIDTNHVPEALNLSRLSLTQMQTANKRTLDQTMARTVYYLARCIEILKAQGKSGGLAEERTALLSIHRTAALRHDVETNATVQNLLLRSYIVESNLYDQADKLVARAPFPRAQAGNGQIARYEYYVGRIRAVQLNYTEAHTHLQQAIRRAPQPSSLTEEEEKQSATTTAASKGDKKGEKEEKEDSSAKKDDAADVPDAYATLKAELKKSQKTPAGVGFLQTAHKYLVVVELLMGDIPERSIFRTPILKKALAPYMEIVQAVRVGDLSRFSKTLSTYTKLFQADKTYSLILRLRHNVIKTGIRTISLAYSRISLADITKKLHLESEEDAEYIVAKAIRDGVIEAQVNHERGEMTSRETGDVYSTNEPQAQLRQRINFCLQLHNESVKAMRYPLNNHKAELDSASAARERERELAQGIADGDISDEDEDWV